MRTRSTPRTAAALLALSTLALPLSPFGALLAQSTRAPAQGARPTTPITATDLLGIVSSQVADLSDDGRWLAVLQQTRADGFGTDVRRDGDPSYIRPAVARLVSINTATGQHLAVFSEPRVLRSPVWSHDGSQLALLALGGDRLQPVIWDRASGRARTLAVPAGWYVAENSDVRWSRDGTRVIVALRRDRWRGRVTAEFARMTQGPVFVQDGRDPFLAWDRLRRQGNVRAVYSLDAATSQPRELLPEGMTSAYQVSEDDSLVTWEDDVTKQTDYDVIFGTERRLMARAAAGGGAQVVLPSLKGVTLAWSSDGRQLAWSREGKVWVQRIGGSDPARQIAGPDSAASSAGGTASDTSAAAREARERQRFAVVRWSPRGDALLLSNREGFWVAPADGAPRTRVVASSDSGTAPRYQPIDWSADGRYLYFSIASRTEWGRGVARYDRESRSLQELVKDTRLYGGVRLAKGGDVLVYSSGEGNRPQELYVADATMRNTRRVTDGNPQLAGKAFARTRLISYHDMDGATRYGVAYLPADYDASKRYPTLFNIYEEFFDDTFDPTINVLTASGYVVVKPSVGFETGFPGEAWAKGVTAAANHLIEAGIADSARLGVFGTSYGGYATNLLITQTRRFRAAVNISGKVDMISFYTDSPRLGVRNVHAAEKSQDRLGATLWQQPQKYVAHSAVMFADRITTPLLLMTGALDPNVPADNTREMFYALRRLGKDVTWVNYMNGGHGTPSTTPADFVDFH
ncbi:MAG: S9 family peptidase, partial [Gemmatimonadaceae bacterium]|nr:S9 family peptidase [Gemmatimonadaceae bacterium]